MAQRFAFVPCVLTVLALLAPELPAQTTEMLLPSPPFDGTIMAQTLGIKQSSGSAELGSLDMGPLAPNPVWGLQSTWLAWNPDHVYDGTIGSGATSSFEVTQPPGVGGLPIAGCIGAATFNGGWVLTTTAGVPSAIRPCAGAFVWTPSRLFLFGVNGPASTIEVFRPVGGPIANVQGVVVIHSYVWDYSTTFGVVSPAIQASALVYTPTNLYHVQLSIPGPIGYGITEVSAPFGGSIALTRGITVLAGEMDSSIFPPTDVQGAALVWNPGHVFLFQKGPGPFITELFDTSGFPMAGCWGAMRIGTGTVGPIRTAGLVWQSSQASIVTIDPGITVARATMPPGSPIDPPILSGVNVPAAGSPLIERQASSLYEIFGSLTWNGPLRRALIVGQSPRSP